MNNKKDRFKTIKFIAKITLVVSVLLVTVLFSLGFFKDLSKYKNYPDTQVFDITDRSYVTVTLKSGKEQYTISIDKLNGIATSSNTVAMALDSNGYPVEPREVIIKKLRFDIMLIGLCIVAVLIIVAVLKREDILGDDED